MTEELKERVKALAVEAGLLNQFPTSGQIDLFERFAQAVARECAALCMEYGTSNTTKACSAAIRARFGIKE